MVGKKRIQSVDILRGFTIIAMILVNTPGDWDHVYAPLLHAPWHGLTPTDLIFPFFLFIVGISIYFAYKNKKTGGSVYKKIGIRSLKLVGLGLFLNLFTPYFPFVVDIETLRFPGVLQRIGVVFFIASVLYLNFNWKVLLGICVSILLGYWLFLGFMPLPDGTAPTFERATHNWVNYIDLKVLRYHMWQPDYDPEGLLSTLPSIVSCLFGVLIGRLLDRFGQLSILFIIAVLLLILGYSFNVVFPINKAIWSSSFVLVSTGWGCLFLALIYYLSDVKNIQFPPIFKYVGMNAITLYFLSSFISKCMYLIKIDETYNLHGWLYHNLFMYKFIDLRTSSLLYAFSVCVFYSLLAYFMFKKKIFIKV
ncbi:DUF1624 domain-containing protein [Tamlana fucoidanivorans]|uniref:DUF1624 domain-containing protein n=1 Tax=Allotamlana fucoidanivorans TaxID=2583814 RepID=A0A5C4SMF9_9FLAO|nr:heparan-alpha-glucosaminide N-acetyltransferase domain-containing protein [Tamlana fucoidanivorans]TNJ45259.1 DUF1624 domain-containing protein [Tamlana fucoidanivorans]